MTLDWRISPSDRLLSELRALREFVDWLRDTYPDLVGVAVKPCWPLHADMRHSLAALRLAWLEAMSRDRGDLGISLIHWEDELERACAGRWRASMTSCDETGCARSRTTALTRLRERRAVEEACREVDVSAMRGGLPPLSTPPTVRRSTGQQLEVSGQLELDPAGGGPHSSRNHGRESP